MFFEGIKPKAYRYECIGNTYGSESEGPLQGNCLPFAEEPPQKTPPRITLIRKNILIFLGVLKQPVVEPLIPKP